MKRINIFFTFFILSVKCLGADIPSQVTFFKWEACSVDNDCTAVVTGCYYWQPINKKYSKELAGIIYACKKSVEPGLKPDVACIDHMCNRTSGICSKDSDCWCSNFNGAKFFPGKVPNRCVKGECAPCFYE
jgi:hypothetical protein